MMGLIICYSYVGLILLGGYGIHQYGEEKSRKFVHIMTANWWLIAMVFFEKVWGPLLISSSFLIVNLVAYKYKIFKQIELKDRDPGYGTIYYSVSMILLSVMSYCMGDLTIGLVGSLTMGYGDGLAALVGKRLPLRSYDIGSGTKSIGGTLTMFWVTFLIVILAAFMGRHSISLLQVMLIASFGTVIEAVSQKGRDNLWVPMGCALLYGIRL